MVPPPKFSPLEQASITLLTFLGQNGYDGFHSTSPFLSPIGKIRRALALKTITV